MISVREEQDHSTFYCKQADYEAGMHMPNVKGYLCGKKVQNGDYLLIIDNDNSYCYDEEGKDWIKKKLILSDGGTGGTGTDDYDDLLNKPQINGVVLRNNKTLKDLKLFHEEEITTASNTWSIQHNLNTPWQELNINIFDSSGNKHYVVPDSSSTANLLVVKFDKAISGNIIIRK